MSIEFLGTKNDTNRAGFLVSVDLEGDIKQEKLNVVAALKCYIDRCSSVRGKGNNSLFIGLNKPYGPIKADTVVHILEEAISLVGLGGKGFSAKSFRPTGAKYTIQHCDADTVMKLGWWKFSVHG